jgi:hypothetical protein
MYLVPDLKVIFEEKKVRFALLSVFFASALFYLSDLLTNDRELFYTLLVLGVLGVVVLAGAQFSDIIKKSWVLSTILPMHLAVGFLITFYYFPFLGPLVRLSAYIGLGIIIYVLLLVNNIFLVVEEKGSVIPLYNAAVIWVQILITTISIPFISGVYKIPVSFLVQNFIVFISSMMLSTYLLWCLHYDKDIIKTTINEKVTLISLLSFLIFIAGVSISFFPSESFLRGLLMSSIFMFNMNYIYGHYKNKLVKLVLYEFAVIIVIFSILLIIFKP